MKEASGNVASSSFLRDLYKYMTKTAVGGKFLISFSSSISVRGSDRVRESGLITGLGPKLDSGHAVTYLQYADDTVIFIQADPDQAGAFKWNGCFSLGLSALSGMKMFYAKSSLVPINVNSGVSY